MPSRGPIHSRHSASLGVAILARHPSVDSEGCFLLFATLHLLSAAENGVDVCTSLTRSAESYPLQAPSRQQVEWLRTTNAPIRRVTFLPSCMPCQSTVSALVTRACDSIHLAPLHHSPDLAGGGTPSQRVGAAA